MSVLFTFLCDGCGKEGTGILGDYLAPDPPPGWTWFWGGPLRQSGPHACSEPCWQKVCRAPDGKLYLPDSHKRRAEERKQASLARAEPSPWMAPVVDIPARGPVVYFIQRGGDGPVKIGFSKNPKGRLSSLQTGIPERLHLLGIVDGGKAEEQRLHRYFAAYGIQGEWFKPAPDLMAYIQTHARAA